jgi:hypothetical protein
MATRSRIGVQLKNGSVLSAYHHWDGYPEWLGRILKTHYNSRELAAELIDGGDMSCCWTDDRWTGDRWGAYPTKVEEYGPQYYSQRGEECPPRHDKDLNEYLCNGEEYAYLFTNGEWVCYSLYGNAHSDIVKEVEIPNGALAV